MICSAKYWVLYFPEAVSPQSGCFLKQSLGGLEPKEILQMLWRSLKQLIVAQDRSFLVGR